MSEELMPSQVFVGEPVNSFILWACRSCMLVDADLVSETLSKSVRVERMFREDVAG